MPPRPGQRRDATLPRAERRARGAYYTPANVVRYIVDETLRGSGIRQNSDGTQGGILAKSATTKVLDPACGDGAFLCEVGARLVSGTKHPVSVLQSSLFGIDCDAAAVAAARINVARTVLGVSATTRRVEQIAAKLADNIIVGDALLDPLPNTWPSGFDAVVGNPPYVNIRRLAKQSVAEAARVGSVTPKLAASATHRYRQRFRCARRGFDLYVLFIERALELLRAGGRCGLIVPNKLATLDYAAPCRTMLVEETQIDLLADFSDLALFEGASVYPHVVVFEKGKPNDDHRVQIVGPVRRTGPPEATRIEVPLGKRDLLQSQLNRRGVFAWQSGFDVEPRVATRPLDELCRLHSGTTGFVAQEIAAELKEREDAEAAAFPFITSANIDRYRVSLGSVRYMQRNFRDPVLPVESALLTPAKRRMFAEPKIVVAGMSKRLEAAWCDQPLALGVQVFAAAEIQIDPFYLLALLNSRLLSHLFRTRFSAKRLAGGYLSVNKGQLARLPIVDPGQVGVKERRAIECLSRLGRAFSIPHFSPRPGTPGRGAGGEGRHLAGLGRSPQPSPRSTGAREQGSLGCASSSGEHDPEIDALVNRLYRLSAKEIVTLNQAFDPPLLRAG